MPLTEKSDNINALGIFGRLEPRQEEYFQQLQSKYYELAEDAEEFGIFPHLTVMVGYKVKPDEISGYLNILRELTKQLPFSLEVDGLRIIDDQNIALAFDIKQTKQIRDIANRLMPGRVINTDYFTVMRGVPKQFRDDILRALAKDRSLKFTDFKLCANRADDAGTIHSSSEF